jgi:hypothetical protein
MAAFFASGRWPKRDSIMRQKICSLEALFTWLYHKIWYLIGITCLYNGLRGRLSPRNHRLTTGFDPETGSY